MKKVFNRELVIVALAVPVLLFIISRMTSFFSEVWGLGVPALVQGIVFAASLALVFVLRKKTYSFLEESAYGISPIAITIYLLSVLLAFKYKGVVLNGSSRTTFDCIIGGGLLFGLFVLLFTKGADALLGKLKKPSASGWIFFITAAVVLNLQGILYCTFMEKIFVWDNAGYFTAVHRLNEIFPSADYFRAVYNSVFELDYNYIIAIPASIFCKLFGESRLVFVLSVINFYLLPLATFIYAVAKRIFKKGWPAAFVALSLPYMVFAANTGFIDIGGVLPAFLAAVIYLWGDGREMSALSGALLALCVMMRRWYSFYALSFIIMTFLWGISRKNIKSSIYALLSFAFVLLFFAQPFVSGKLMADYKDMYSAYALGVGADLRIFTRYFGVVLFAAAALWAITKQIKRPHTFSPELFMLLQGIICFVLFTRVQTHGQQHLALYVPMFIIEGLSFLSALKKKHAIYAACAVCVLHTASTFLPRIQPKSIDEIKGVAVLPTFSSYPPRDKNARSFLKVTEYMDERIGMKGKTVCFLASSLEMNYDTLKNAEVSLSVEKKYDIDRESYYLPIADVDKRDGLLKSLFEAEYILVPDELQLHLSPEEQKVISVPYSYITQGTGFGGAYEKQEKVFTLDSGHEIYLYKRLRDITEEEIKEVSEEIFK